jgi:hypothetical protein
MHWNILKGCRRAIAGTLAIALAAIALSGCSFFAGAGPDSGPGPHVANCTLIQQATPTLYVCNGKTYTATQLYDIRRGNQVPTGLPPNAVHY